MSDQPEALRLAEYMDAPLNDPRDVADAAAAELRRLHAERDKLRDFALYYARCPCCQQEANCVDDCTFSSDDPNAAEAMDEARAALKEVKP